MSSNAPASCFCGTFHFEWATLCVKNTPKKLMYHVWHCEFCGTVKSHCVWVLLGNNGTADVSRILLQFCLQYQYTQVCEQGLRLFTDPWKQADCCGKKKKNNFQLTQQFFNMQINKQEKTLFIFYKARTKHMVISMWSRKPQKIKRRKITFWESFPKVTSYNFQYTVRLNGYEKMYYSRKCLLK